MNDSKHQSGLARLKVAVCIAALMPVVLGGAGDVVLCFGDNGHIALEIAHGEPCESRPNGRGDRSPDHAGLETQRPACFDILIAVHGPIEQVYHKSLAGSDDGRDRIGPPSCALAESAETAPERAGPSVEVFRSIPPDRQSFISYRTTVLLI